MVGPVGCTPSLIVNAPSETSKQALATVAGSLGSKVRIVNAELQPLKKEETPIAFLPQFIDPEHRRIGLQQFTPGLIFNLNGMLVNAMVSVIAACAARKIGQISKIASLALVCSWPASLFCVSRAGIEVVVNISGQGKSRIRVRTPC